MKTYTIYKPTRCNRPVEFTEALRLSFRNIFNFKGRARRSEFWWTTVGVYLITLVVYLLAMLIGAGTAGFADLFQPESVVSGSLSAYGIVIGAWAIVAWILMFALSVRRLHDTGHSGWLIGTAYLLGFAGFTIVFIGTGIRNSLSLTTIGMLVFAVYLLLALYIFFLTIFDSDVEENKYGPSQKYAPEPVKTPRPVAEEPRELPVEETSAEEPAPAEPAGE